MMRKREKQINLYLSKKEYEELVKRSKKNKLSISTYIRDKYLNFNPTLPDIKILTDHTEDWRLIGNGLNAIARDANRYGYLDEKLCLKYFNYMDRVIDDIRSRLKNQ